MRLKTTLLLLAIICLAAPGHAGLFSPSDLAIQPNFRGLTSYGTFEKHMPVGIGAVTDRRSVADPKFLGKGPNGAYSIYTQDPPNLYIRAALAETLQTLGLAAKPDESPAISVSAEVWRAHSWVRIGARARLRCEMNVRFFVANAAGERVGTVGVVGNAEIKGQMVTKEKWKALFDQTIYDTMENFARSEALARALGSEVTASFKKSATPAQARYNAADIETTKFYGPTELVATLPKVDLSQYNILELHPFKVTDEGFKGDVEAMQKMVPGSVMDRLGGLYPELFTSASFGATAIGKAPEGGKRLIIEGDLPIVAVGSFMKRAVIGFGAGRISLIMNVRLLDGESGKELARMEMKSLNWGAAWQASEGELDDMVDRMASDLTYYLIDQHNPGYKNSEEQIR